MTNTMNKAYLLGMYEKAVPEELSWKDRLIAAKEGGFDYLEMSIDESDGRLARLDWGSKERKQLFSDVEAAGIPISSICLSAHRKYPFGAPGPKVRKRSLEIMRKAIDFACNFGIRTIQIPGYDVYYEKSTDATRAYFVESLAAACEMAKKAGVLLGFETMEDEFMNTVEKAMAYVRRMQCPYLAVYPDLGNITNASLLYGNSVAEDVATGRGHIIAVHCKETVKGVYREMKLGTGTTDFDGAFAELVNQGVRRYVAEFWYLGSDTWRQDVADAARFIRTKLDAAFAKAGAV